MSIAFVNRRSVNILVLACSAAMLGCGYGSSSNGITNPPPPPVVNGSTLTIKVQTNGFSPATDSVAVGSTITWTWNTCTTDQYGDTQCEDHSVHFDDGPASPVQHSGTFVRTFASEGTFTYHDDVNSSMTGKVIVH